MSRAHVAAVTDVLEAVPNLTVYTTRVDNDPPPSYVVVYSDTGIGRNYRLCSTPSQQRFTVATLYVGRTDNEARWVAEKVTAALEGARLTVDGRLCGPVRAQSSQPLRPDPDASDLVSGTDVWTFTSN